MTQVLDYSAGFPGAQAIRAARYAGAVRYIGFPDRLKCTTAAELADFTANGLGMALVHENTQTDWRGGYSAGQIAARRARDHATTIGFPPGRPIYFAIDQDVVTTGQFSIMLDYLRGAGSMLGGAGLVGVYGEADVIDRARDAGVAAFFWQTVAWSGGRQTTCHLFQHFGTVYVGGVACDINDVNAPDWGQHKLVENTMSAADAYTGVVELLKDVQNGQANDIRQILVGLVEEGVYNAFARVTKDMATDVAPDLAEAWRKILPSMTDTQTTTLANFLATTVIQQLTTQGTTGVTEAQVRDIVTAVLTSTRLSVGTA